MKTSTIWPPEAEVAMLAESVKTARRPEAFRSGLLPISATPIPRSKAASFLVAQLSGDLRKKFFGEWHLQERHYSIDFFITSVPPLDFQ